jgi:large subunit ribosomal protein L35
MPKMKTKKAAAKRFRPTKNGHFTRGQAYSRHLKSSKSSKRRRNLRGSTVASEADEGAIKHMLPYS